MLLFQHVLDFSHRQHFLNFLSQINIHCDASHYIVQLDCHLNYVDSQGENKCPTAEENGVSILHGNALAFVKVITIMI